VINTKLILMTFLLISTAFMSAVTAQYGKMNIAVNELIGKGIDTATASIISDRLRAELINSGVFRVMERSEMESILKEQGFQKSGACDEASCLVDVGQLLGVNRILAGSVGNVGGFWTVSVRMINVVTGEILFTENEDYEGDTKGVISQVTARLALKIAESAGGEIKKILMAGKKGDLFIQTSQPGASIEIDGKVIDSLTPLTLRGYEAGEHRIVARKGGWYGSQIITLNPDDLLKVNLDMKQGKGSVKVFSTPAEAIVFIDGKEIGKTPLKVNDLDVGQHEILVAKINHISQKQFVQITMGETQNINIALPGVALIKVSVEPQDANIVINGKEKNLDFSYGMQKHFSFSVPAGEVTIQFEAPGYEVYRKQLTLLAGEEEQIDAKLVSLFGTLKVETIPSGADVFLNDRRVGFTPYKNLKIKPGKYSLRIEKPTYEPIKADLTIIKGLMTVKSFTDNSGTFELKHAKAYLDSISSVKVAARKQAQWVRRIVFGAFTAGSFGAGLYFNNEIQKSVVRLNRLQVDYRSASMNFDSYQNAYENEDKKVSQNKVFRDLSYEIGAIFSFGLLISIPF
jgi:hypothetical protein